MVMNINDTLDRINKARGLGSSNACYDVMYFVTRLHKCKSILEIGTHQGASAITFCQAVLDNNDVPEIITVDNWSQLAIKDVAINNFEQADMLKYITMVEGDSVDVVPNLVQNKMFDLVLIDGNHGIDTIAQDYLNVKDHTRMILFHDTGYGDKPYLKYIGGATMHFNTKYVEGDGHIVGITLVEVPQSTQPKILITGNGRCGTGYMSQVLSIALGKPIGHEDVFTPFGINYENMLQFYGSSSWLVAPLLPISGYEVWHLVRNPKDVIASFRGIKFFQHQSDYQYLQYVNKHIDISNIPDDAIEAAFYVKWNEMIEKSVPADHRIRIEDINPSTIIRIANGHDLVPGWESLIKQVPTTYNTGNREPVMFDSISQPYRDMISNISKRYGYGERW
jgi:hypothetical protein